MKRRLLQLVFVEGSEAMQRAGDRAIQPFAFSLPDADFDMAS